MLNDTTSFKKVYIATGYTDLRQGIAETAKANNFKPYEYLKYRLYVILGHLDGKGRSFMDKLLPWSDELSSECRKLIK